MRVCLGFGTLFSFICNNIHKKAKLFFLKKRSTFDLLFIYCCCSAIKWVNFWKIPLTISGDWCEVGMELLLSSSELFSLNSILFSSLLLFEFFVNSKWFWFSADILVSCIIWSCKMCFLKSEYDSKDCWQSWSKTSSHLCESIQAENKIFNRGNIRSSTSCF